MVAAVLMRFTFFLFLGFGLFGCDDAPSPSSPPPNDFTFAGNVARNKEDVVGARVLFGTSSTYRGFGDTGPFSTLQASGIGGAFNFPHAGPAPDPGWSVAIRDDALGTPIFAQFVGIHKDQMVYRYPLSGTQPRSGWSARVHTTIMGAPASAKRFFIASGNVVGIAPDPSRDEVTVFWNGGYQQTVLLQAVFYQEDPATQLPASYLGYATGSVKATDQGDPLWLATFQPLATSTANIVFSPPDGVQGSIFVDTGDDSSAQELARFTGNTSVTVPHIDFARYSVRAVHTADGARASIFWLFGTGDANVNPIFDPPVALTSPPAAGSTIPRNNMFQWSSGGVVDLRIDAGKYGQSDIYTSAGGAALPADAWNLLGLDIPSGTPVSVSLVHFPDPPSLDTALEFSGLDTNRVNFSQSAPLSLILQ